MTSAVCPSSVVRRGLGRYFFRRLTCFTHTQLHSPRSNQSSAACVNGLSSECSVATCSRIRSAGHPGRPLRIRWAFETIPSAQACRGSERAAWRNGRKSSSSDSTAPLWQRRMASAKSASATRASGARPAAISWAQRCRRA